MATKQPEDWMRKGVLVEYCPEYMTGAKPGEKFTGRLESDPFRIRSGGRWVVRIGDMDERYQQITGRNVQTFAGIQFIKQFRRGGHD